MYKDFLWQQGGRAWLPNRDSTHESEDLFFKSWIVR